MLGGRVGRGRGAGRGRGNGITGEKDGLSGCSCGADCGYEVLDCVGPFVHVD